MSIHLPPRVCRDLSQALEREWLVTNGLGGYAAGTIAGALTRRYHGLLIAALSPPVDRRLLVAKLDCTAELNGQKHLLYTNIWRDGVEQPNACRVLWRFDLVDGVPAWTFRLGQIDLVQRIWMEHGRNVTYVRYETAAGAAAPVTLSARLLVGDRDHHFLGSDANRGFQVEGEGPMLEIRPPQAPVVLQVRCAAARGSRVRWRIGHTWCRGFALPVEQARGFDCRDDYLAAGLCTLRLDPGRPATFVLAAGDASDLDVDGAWERCTARARELIER